MTLPPLRQPRSTRAHRLRRNAPAFALPLVAMMILVASIVMGLLLSQQATTSLSVARQVNGYQAHHDAAGLREITSRWLTTVRGKIGESLDPDGLAFRLTTQRSGLMEVRMVDGQGSCLSDTSVLTGRRREIVESMNQILSERAALAAARGGGGDVQPPADPAQALTRPAGPPSISYLSAPPEVLEALVYSVVQNKKSAERTLRTLLNREAFSDSKTPVKAVMGALKDTGLSKAELSELEGMMVSPNALWFVTIEIRDRSGALHARSGGLYDASDTHGDSFNQVSGFLTWEVLPLE